MGKAITTDDVKNAQCSNCEVVGKSHLSKHNELFPDIKSHQEIQHELSETVKMYEQADKDSTKGQMMFSKMMTLLWVLKRT
ncbi:MAG: hypothetical protein WAL88_01700 [Nitrosotalea sp.]